MNESELLAAIERYRHSDMDRAILLNGAWGSGKTYFVLNHLEKQQKHIYLSAFGLKSSSEIDKAILVGIPKDALDNGKRSLKEKTRRILAKIPDAAREILKQISFKGIKLPDSLFDAATIVSLSTSALKDCLIIIDDIERSSIPFSDLLGKINTYTEQYGLKVLLIANTNEITGQDAEIFQKYHDKIIREELHFQQDYLSILQESIGKIANQSVHEALEERLPVMFDFIDTFNLSNVRQIQSGIEKASETIAILEANSLYRDDPEYSKLITDIVLFSLCSSANLDDYHVDAFQDIQSIQLETEHDGPWHLRYFEFIESRGVLEIHSSSAQISELLDKHLKTLIDSRQASNDPVMQLYNKCHYLEDEAIINYEKAIIKKLKSGKYSYEYYPRIILVLIRAKNILEDSTFLNQAEYYILTHLDDIDDDNGNFINLSTFTFYSQVEADEYKVKMDILEKMVYQIQDSTTVLAINKTLGNLDWSTKFKDIISDKVVKIVAAGQFLSMIDYLAIIDRLRSDSAKAIDYRNLQEAFATIYDRASDELVSFSKSDYMALKTFHDLIAEIQPKSHAASQALKDFQTDLEAYIDRLEANRESSQEPFSPIFASDPDQNKAILH